MKSLDVIKNITKLEKDSVSISDDYIRDLFGEHDGDISTPKDYYTIDEIDSILSKTENTKYTTENGIKEFECKDGYVDNVVIEGETLVNLSDMDASYGTNLETSDRVKVRFINKDRCSNGTYTLINFTDKTIKFNLWEVSTHDFSKRITVDAFSSVKAEIESNLSIYGVEYWISDGWSNADLSIYKSSMYAILEGDHTDKPISYFEGLKSVGQGDKIEVLTRNQSNKNLFYGDVELGYIDNKTGVNGNSVNGVRSVEYIKVDKNTTYTVSDDKDYNVSVNLYGENKSEYFGEIYGKTPYTFTTDDKTYWIRLRTYTGSKQNDTTIKWQLEKGNKSTEYVQPKYDKKQISTTLRSLPSGVKDTIEKRGNKYVKVQRCGEVTLNGSEDWFRTDVSQNNTIQFAVRKGTDVAYKGDNEIFMYCDKIKGIEEKYWNNDDEFIFINSKDFVVSLRKSKLSSQNVEGFKTWLQSNPITVVYELATPIIIELTNFNPQVFEGNTTLMLNTGTIQGECDFEVTNSKGSEIEVIKYKLSSIDSQISESILALKELGGIL